MSPVLQGLGTALILAIIDRVRDSDEQSRAAASAEVRALQARMNPHFLFNALNTLAALSRIAPREVPGAVGGLHQFLRASFDQHERLLVTMEEELALVRAYLEIESLRLGDRLKGREDDRSVFVEGSNAAILFPTAGRERGPSWTPLLAGGRATASDRPSGRAVVRDERY
jgi:Histidine kinase